MELDKLKNQRTCYCSQVNEGYLDKEICLQGWVNNRRDHGGVFFVDLRDRSGVVQVVFDPSFNAAAHQKADLLRNEFVIEVKGKVIRRSPETVNPKMDTGTVEVMVNELLILNQASVPPFQINEDTEINEKTGLKYRFLDLRRKQLQKNMILRSNAAKVVRDFMHNEGFLDIETPFLTKSTPEGARDYLVPSRVNPGTFYALPQSPQIFKQILMVSGFDRYYQITRCFRDEDLRGNRQPEFTQIDVELSFCTQEMILNLFERMIADVFLKTIGLDVKPPFQRMTYDEAMHRYGVDSPDLRFGLELVDLTPIMGNTGFKVFDEPVANNGIVKAILVPGGSEFSRSELDSLTDFVRIYKAKGMAWVKLTNEGWQSPIAKFLSDEKKKEIEQKMQAKTGDLILFGADKVSIVNASLGNLREEIARRNNLIDPSLHRFVWIYDFPLFEYNPDEKRYDSVHHPFTSPYLDDFEKHYQTDPSKIKSQAYDLVLNGEEIGGGSLRIHDTALQKKIFKLLNISNEEADEKFGFLLKALEYGAPPHGGIAFGFDRIIMFLAKTESIRDVIAFPKTQQAACLMSEAPSTVAEKQLQELHISIRKAVLDGSKS